LGFHGLSKFIDMHVSLISVSWLICFEFQNLFCLYVIFLVDLLICKYTSLSFVQETWIQFHALCCLNFRVFEENGFGLGCLKISRLFCTSYIYIGKNCTYFMLPKFNLLILINQVFCALCDSNSQHISTKNFNTAAYPTNQRSSTKS
jgi:hypothetical protein